MLPTIKIHFERWRFNKDYGVWVSTHGRFRDKNKKELPIKIDSQGYCRVKVDCAIYKLCSAHRLVMLTWRPTDEAENLTVDHKNHNKRDNSLANLEWVTYEENARRAAEDFVNCPSASTTNTADSKYDNLLICVDKYKTMTLLEAAQELADEHDHSQKLAVYKKAIYRAIKMDHVSDRAFGHRYTLDVAPIPAYKHLLAIAQSDIGPYTKGMQLCLQPNDASILATASALDQRIQRDDFSRSTFTQICRNILNGVNTEGSKKYYGFEIKGVKA